MDSLGIERLKVIQNCSNSLLELLNDVLDFSKLEVGKVELENQPFALHAVVNEMVEFWKIGASEKKVVLSYQNDKNVPMWIVGDVTRFRQILSNLISNAIKFTEIGSVKIRAQATQLDGEKWKIQFAVKDTGIGIPDNVKDKLFQSFSQVDASTTRRFGGTGLGLAICKGLCEKMGGSIWVEGALEQGSTFFFTLIAKETQAVESAIEENSFAAVDSAMGSKHPLKILVAEDNEINRLVALGFLEKLGYRAALASNGNEVLKCLDHQFYDLILMDCHMPEMDGFEATQRIMAKYSVSNRPRIFALTASTTKEDIDRCMASGMDGFLSKPMTMADLVETLRKCQPTGDRHGQAA